MPPIYLVTMLLLLRHIARTIRREQPPHVNIGAHDLSPRDLMLSTLPENHFSIYMHLRNPGKNPIVLKYSTRPGEKGKVRAESERDEGF
jgi:hypothetical protein